MVRFSVDRESLRCILAVSLPLIPTGFSVMLMRRSGVLFIDDAFGKSAAGLYGVAMNLATVILFLSVPVINVWTPYVYEKLAQSHAPDALESLFHRFLLLAAATLLASTLFSLFSRPILDVMTTEAFSAAGRFIPWLAFGFASWALLALLTPFLVHFNRQNAIALIATAGAAVNLGLNSLLIGKFGPVGAAGSFFAANFFSALVMLVVVCRTGGSSFWPSARRRRRETRGGVALSREEIG
jgi:O-antigen/teichoic acid export membrane protein